MATGSESQAPAEQPGAAEQSRRGRFPGGPLFPMGYKDAAYQWVRFALISPQLERNYFPQATQGTNYFLCNSGIVLPRLPPNETSFLSSLTYARLPNTLPLATPNLATPMILLEPEYGRPN